MIYSLIRAYLLLKAININRDVNFFYLLKQLESESKLLGGTTYFSNNKTIWVIFPQFINKLCPFIIQLSPKFKYRVRVLSQFLL